MIYGKQEGKQEQDDEACAQQIMRVSETRSYLFYSKHRSCNTRKIEDKCRCKRGCNPHAGVVHATGFGYNPDEEPYCCDDPEEDKTHRGFGFSLHKPFFLTLET